MRFLLLISGAAYVAGAQTDPRVTRDIAYAEPRNERQMLDVYAPAAGSNHPVAVWIHGGGWMQGGKNEVDNKPLLNPQNN